MESLGAATPAAPAGDPSAVAFSAVLAWQGGDQWPREPEVVGGAGR